MKKYLIWNILIALMVITVAYIRFYPNHVDLPTGCDEFGYLQLSEAIAEGSTFEPHTARPFIKPLIAYLKSKGYTYKEYAWIIAPHAYHLEADTEQIINQYPPGTSALMAVFPKYQRQFCFPALIFFLIYLLGLGVIYLKKNTLLQTEVLTMLLLLFCLFAMTTAPILKELTNVNSVAPTLAFLLAGGMLLHSYPLIGIVLISFSINFRLANVLVIPLFAAFYVFDPPNGKSTLQSVLKRGSSIVILTLLVGLAVYMFYAEQLLDSPLALTYSDIDQKSVDMYLFLENLSFYFGLNQMWMICNLLLLIAMVWLLRKKQIKRSFFYVILGTLLLVYSYFLLHAAKASYYPYAPSVIMFGILFDRLSRMDVWKYKWIAGIKVAGVIAVCVIGMSNYAKFRAAYAQDHFSQVTNLQECFATYDYDVVWGELKTGTVEYATAIPTMRYFWGNDKIRADIMNWLRAQGLKQAIYLTDLGISLEEIGTFMNQYNVPLKDIRKEACGVIIYLE